MQNLLYAEVNLVCIIVCGMICGFQYRVRENTQRVMYFRRALMSSTLFCITDLIYALVSNAQTPHILLLYGINMAYFMMTAFMSYFWMIYVGLLTKWTPVHDKRIKPYLHIPSAIVALLTLSSPFTKAVFYVTESGEYIRGSLYLVHMFFSFVGITYVSARAFILSFRPQHFLDRSMYRAVFFMILYPMICQTISMFVPGIPLLCVGIVAAVLQMQLTNMQEQISQDPLTGLNNRRVMEQYLSRMMETHREAPNEKHLYLFMMDVDGFKGINDRFGHVEGDKALLLISDVLKMTGASFGGMVARYGGDEFVRICELESDREAERFCTVVQENLEQMCREMGLPYTVRISIGYAIYGRDLALPSDFVANADKVLYDVKQEHKTRKLAKNKEDA